VEWTADSIRRAREARGWSQRELADELTKHVKTAVRSITDWETGKARPSGRRLAALDRVFGGASADFNPRAILAELTDDEVAELLEHVPDMVIVATVARRFARTEHPPRHVASRSWNESDAPPISPRDEAGDEQQA
jgi:transcriptional regulator with XRE-family HTH domain